VRLKSESLLMLSSTVNEVDEACEVTTSRVLAAKDRGFSRPRNNRNHSITVLCC
jgi:hypothetical protein